ncbi:26S proteasome regulatory complex non-ATPase subcomplex Rpn1 subunit [Coniophora puteana RWD-64-598 SS2]|uniref:26S proteasome regulatory subunit RPN1 n=1 Tax=Coniophora puteana (strain RWD-64-598) TaxID=741705 RepID=A0A5M3MDY4_CONPW|nr:26S proteasome regulatory complex non-ATPase subcomplex Rpn1 subunit [Coniophora puteana RWD-64-598 SS2]EIW77206.1 26S proteasome regulatory complex non-ATPase subcomplex Rpn1 subunit [Coniophora puteana RWD-64-598 SS2]
MPERAVAEIAVPSKDPKDKKKEEEEKAKKEGKDGASKTVNGDKTQDEEEELSEEDQQLKAELDMLVERLNESNTELHRPALESLRSLIRTSTSSMTSVPKPLKFLHPHYPSLQLLYEQWPPSEDKSLFADILSVLAMTYSDTQPRGSLRYRLLSTSLLPASSKASDPGSWGHEYVRHLAAELGEEYTIRSEGEDAVPPPEAAEKPVHIKVPGTFEDLKLLALECARYFMHHNAEPDAVDLLVELEMINDIVDLVDENTYGRVCIYMIRCVSLLPPPDDLSFLRSVHAIYLRFSKFPEALSLAIRLNDADLIRQDFNASGNPTMKRQLAFLLARAQIPIEWLVPPNEDGDGEEEMPTDLVDCLSNTHLSELFREFGKELDVTDARSLEDVYKSHLENTRAGTSANVDSARANLAGTFVNAFVNAGFGNDKLMVEAEEGNSWVYKNKDHGMLSAAASLGVSLLWDTDVGLSHVDKYTYSAEEYIKAGALFATGILNTGVRTEADAALALLGEYVENKSVPLRTSAIMGLGLAYAGSHREDLLQLLLPTIADDGVSMEIASLSALALGFIFVGSGNGEVTSTILQTLMERDDKSLDEKWSRYLVLGLAFLFVGLQDASDATLETLKIIEHPVSKQAQILVEVCAFAGTGNVLRVQSLLHFCGEHLETVKEREEAEKDAKEKEEEKENSSDKKEEKEEKKQDDLGPAFAVLGLALLAMGEEIGSEMSMRQFNHLMHYGDPIIRKSVPLALGLLSISNPQLSVLDTLSRYSHDNDLAVALNAIFAMGLVGAGTNNARLAQMLRQLAGYYYKEPDCLFTVRIAQGLVHMGKGTIGLNPFFSDRNILSRPAIAGLLATIMAFTDAKAFILDKYHWMLYFLTTAMYPRFLITLDEELKPKPVSVRVGQAVDVVGQAGKPRTISGFQTHTTPVRLGTTERAELATEEFIPFSHALEGFVILQKNPGWEQEDTMQV